MWVIWSNSFSFFFAVEKCARPIITAETRSTQRKRGEEKSGNRKIKAQSTKPPAQKEMSLSTITNHANHSATSGPMMKASVLCDVGRLELRDVPRPVISSNEVLVRVAAVGICGTDAHIFAGHANYNTNDRGQPIPLALQPQILGHEISGTIEEVGVSVDDLHPGDRVVLDQGLNCVSRRREVLCDYCRSGHSHQCEFYREHGITG